MINFQELEKVAEFKNGELNWLEGRDINAARNILRVGTSTLGRGGVRPTP